MNMNQNLSQKLDQRQKLTLEVQNVLKLLQLNAMELNIELHQIVEENPLLEIEDEDYELIDELRIEDEEYNSEDEYSIYMSNQERESEKWDFERIEGPKKSFVELLSEFAFLILNKEEFKAFEALKDKMDGHGMLTERISKISKDSGIKISLLNRVIEKLRNGGFDGVFSCNKAEMERILGKGIYPSSGYDDGKPIRYIEPDIYIDYVDKKFIVTAGSCGLAINIDDNYKKILNDGSGEEEKFLRKKLKEANFYVEALERRRMTLIFIGKKIVEKNFAYLLNRSEKLETLKMKDIAKDLGVVVSTVSRAVKDKFIQTPRGVLPLRYFFGNMQKREKAMEMIEEILIEKGDCSDKEISQLLKERGIKVARRTVNKYRRIIEKE
ncbi:MAG: RNA polymerase subunit sigma-54 [Kosmotoga sp.]|nr:MAG: RNA polymerase subunit sigma-54 [Kosmotoga sp.]